MGNGEITVDGQYVTGMTIDGQEVIEVSIDGCTFGFEKLIRTGYFAVTGGSGSKVIDLSEARSIVSAGIRFRGRASVTTTIYTSLGSSLSIGPTTSTDYICGTPSKPPVSSPPYGCSHSGATGWSVSMCGYKHPDEIGNIGYCVKPAYSSAAHCSSVDDCWEAWGYTTSSSDARGCVRARAAGDTVAATARVRTRYNRTCYSADTEVEYPNGLIAQYPFILSSGYKSPNGTGVGVVECPDETGDLFWAMPLPNVVFNAGSSNTVRFTEILGSGNVDVELYILYR